MDRSGNRGKERLIIAVITTENTEKKSKSYLTQVSAEKSDLSVDSESS
jgi:hypothetical protein